MHHVENKYQKSSMKRLSSMSRLAGALVLAASLLISGCGSRHQQAINTDEYVEVDNPFVGDSPDGNSKIWVPRKSVERGLPRGGELAKKAYEKVASNLTEQSAILDASKPPVGGVRKRLLVAESGDQTIGAFLRKFLSLGIIVKGVERPSANQLATDQEHLALIASHADQPFGGPILIISKPEGTKPGARIKADLYDTRGPALIRSYWVAVPQPLQGQSAEDAVQSALKGLADTALSSLEWLPWYGRVISVNGERIYVDAGAENGFKAGQRLRVYRGGDVVKGIGFAAGEQITSFQIVELVGHNGSFGSSALAAKVKPGDYVELDR